MTNQQKPMHSPGPWHVTTDPHGRDIFVARQDGSYVPMATPFREDAFSTDPDKACVYDLRELEANARFMAMAPEMLDALESALLHSGYGIDAILPSGDAYFDIPNWVFDARRVVRRAKGLDK